jgi:hypothetical protein
MTLPMVAGSIPMVRASVRWSMFGLRWIAASEGTMLREVVNEMTAKLKELGPSPLNREALGKEKMIG